MLDARLYFNKAFNGRFKKYSSFIKKSWNVRSLEIFSKAGYWEIEEDFKTFDLSSMDIEDNKGKKESGQFYLIRHSNQIKIEIFNENFFYLVNAIDNRRLILTSFIKNNKEETSKVFTIELE